MPNALLLSDLMAGCLSENALGHLRDARVRRIPELTASTEALRGQLLRQGFPVHAALLDLEARVGGAAFPNGNVLGALCFLQAEPTLRPADLPARDGGLWFPIYGNPEYLAEWESPFGLLSPAGDIAMFDAPYAPLPAFNSLAHFLEYVAFAPLTRGLHGLRVDALYGEMLAGLLGAEPHPPLSGDTPLSGDFTLGWVGADLWVEQVQLGPLDAWSRQRGTWVFTESPDRLVELIPLLLEQGLTLGHQGPTGAPPAGAPEVLAFIDGNPELGYRARRRVQVWGRPG